MYAPATRRKLVDLLYGVGLFVAASLLLRDSRSIVPVFGSLAAVGSVISFVGVLQILSGDKRILWQYELLWGGDSFASFVNANNASGFLLICFSASIFFVAQMVLGLSHDREAAANAIGDSIESTKSTAHRGLRSISRLQSSHLYFLTAIILIIAGVMMTGSRGGILAAVASVVLFGLLLSRASLFAVFTLMVVLVASAVAVISYSEQSDRISDEIQTLSDFSDAAAPRLQHWQDAVPYGFANAMLGTGNGTYRYLSSRFQKHFTVKTFAHAENIYIETLVEMGAGGVILLGLCIMYCLYASVSLYIRPAVFDQALAITGISCLSGQALIGLLDFGIYLPANTTAMALVMAAVVGRYSSTSMDGHRYRGSTATSSLLKFCATGILMLTTCWAIYESYGIELRRSAKRSIKLIEVSASEGVGKTRGSSLASIKRQLKEAESIRPDDSEVQFLLGSLEVTQYRLKRASQMTQGIKDSIKGLAELDISSEERDLQRKQLESLNAATVWGMTAIPLLHQRLRVAQRSNPEISKEILNDKDVSQHLSDAFEYFCNAEELCDLYPRTRVKMAQLAALSESAQNSDTLEQELIHLKEALSRSIPKTQTLFNCGLLALNSGNVELAVELWKKCLQQPHLHAHERSVVEFSLQMLPMKRLYEEVLPQKPEYLLKIGRRYLSGKEYSLPQKFLIVHVRRLINQNEGLDELDKNLLLAQAANLIHDYPEVSKKYGAVLLLAPEKAPWRYDYAFALFKTKQFDEAVRQLKVCELNPSFRKNRIKWLLDRIRKQRSARSAN